MVVVFTAVVEMVLVGVIDIVYALISGYSYIYSGTIVVVTVGGKRVVLVTGRGWIDTTLAGFVVLTDPEFGLVRLIVLFTPDAAIDAFTGFALGVTTTCSTIVIYPLPVTFPRAFA